MENKMDMVDRAESAIKNLKTDNQGNISLTTSQIRKFLAAVTVLKNKVDLYFNSNAGKNKEALPADLAEEIKFLKVHILYNAGKDKYGIVKDFIDQSKLAEEISRIGTNKEKFYELCRYVEALIAFHKFYGGKDSKN